MVNIKIIVSILFLCSLHSLQAQFTEIKKAPIQSIDLYVKFGAGKPSEGAISEYQNAMEWGIGAGASFALKKRWDLFAVFTVERGKILSSKGHSFTTVLNPNVGKDVPITRQETYLHYLTLSVMPRYYLDRNGRFFVGIGAYASNVFMKSTDWTDSEGYQYRGINARKPLGKDLDYGVLLYVGTKFHIRERPFEAGLCYRYGFVDFHDPLNGSFRMNSFFATLKTPVYIFKKK